MSSYDQPDPDDMFSDTRMSFGEHIEDLRKHLIRAIAGFVIAVIIAFIFAPSVLHFIAAPVVSQLEEFWKRFNSKRETELQQEIMQGKVNVPPIHTSFAVPGRQLEEFLERKYPGLTKLKEGPFQFDIMPALEALSRSLGIDEAVEWSKISSDSYVEFNGRIMNPYEVSFALDRISKVIRPPMLTTLAIQEGFVVYFKVAIMTGFVLGSPWIFYQVWMFIAAGLYPHEKKYVNTFLPFSLGLFLAGVAVCEFFVMSRAVAALLFFNEWLGFAPDLRLNEWLGFAIFMPLVFGICFQTPLVMLFVQRIGVLTVDSFRKFRRIAWFSLAVFAAVITPDPSPISMMFLWIPMSLLYELGIFLCVYLPGKPLLEFGVPDSDELVEV
jgi:sec-independent protein translocase protein TatC